MLSPMSAFDPKRTLLPAQKDVRSSLKGGRLQERSPFSQVTYARPACKSFDRGTDPLQLRSLLLDILKLVTIVSLILIVALSGTPRSFAAEKVPMPVPAWMRAHVGKGEGQIAPVVLQRARALYLQKVREGVVKNPCYLAMDATRPSSLGHGKLGRRFYIICEDDRSFRAISSGYGSGRNLRGIANFSNGRRCAKNFSNATDSRLTTGGAYVTAEETTSFKGYYRVSAKKNAPFLRTFVQFDGEGDTANARPREIGGHPAVMLRAVCRKKDPQSPYANDDGYIPFGRLVNYTGGRSSGCTSWSPSDSRTIIAMLKGNPTTLYIYPESDDIAAVARAVKARRSLSRAGLYWNASCLRQIGTPKFWPKETLEPIIAKYKKDHPLPPRRPLPICRR